MVESHIAHEILLDGPARQPLAESSHEAQADSQVPHHEIATEVTIYRPQEVAFTSMTRVLRFILLIAVVPLIGCATTGWNTFVYGNPKGFTPFVPTPHARQTVWSNLPASRYAQLVSELSQVTTLRHEPIYVTIGSYPCGLCTSGAVIYVDPNFLSVMADDEVMAALAHEIAHGDLGHIGRSQLAGELVSVIFRTVARGNLGEEATVAHDVVKNLTVAQFSQAQEKEADRQAVAYLQALGYDGRTVTLKMLSKVESLGLNQWATWFSSHPSIHERIASARGMDTPRTTGQVHWSTILTTPLRASDYLYRDATFDFASAQTYAIVNTCTPETSRQCERERDALKYLDNDFRFNKGYRRLDEPLYSDVLVAIEIADPQWTDQRVNRPIPWSTYEADAKQRYGSTLGEQPTTARNLDSDTTRSALDLARSRGEATGIGKVYDVRLGRLVWSEANSAVNMTSFVLGLFKSFPPISDTAKGSLRERVNLELKIRGLINEGRLPQGRFDGVKGPAGYFGKYFLLMAGADNHSYQIPLEILPVSVLRETARKIQ